MCLVTVNKTLPHVGIIYMVILVILQPQILLKKFPSQCRTAYLVGGLTSSNSENYQVANNIIQGSVSGIFFSPEVQTVIGHTQGMYTA